MNFQTLLQIKLTPPLVKCLSQQLYLGGGHGNTEKMTCESMTPEPEKWAPDYLAIANVFGVLFCHLVQE